MRESYKRNPRAYRIIKDSIIAISIGIATPLALYQDGQMTLTAKQPDPNFAQDQPLSGPLQKGTPEYDTMLPQGKSIKDFGGWTRVSPPNRDPVFAYSDKIGSIPIIVSQQPLPKDFADQPDQQIQQFAAGYSANKKLTVANSTVFIGTSAKGPQSAIILKGNLLILIKSSAAVPDSDWILYIESLM